MGTRASGGSAQHEHSERVGLHARAPAGVGRQARLRLSRRWHQRAEPRLPRGRRARSSSSRSRHEEIAAFAACAHAKLTGEVGVCMATSGPGRDPPAQRPLRRQARPRAGAWRSSASRSACRSAATTSRRSTCARCSRTSRAEYLAEVQRPARRPRTWSTARCGSRWSQRTVTAIIVPSDVQELPLRGAAARARRALRRAPGYAPPCVVPATRTCAAPPRSSTPASKVAMLVGQGAKGATDEVIEVADLLGAGVAKALNGRAARARRPAVRHRLDRPARDQAAPTT